VPGGPGDRSPKNVSRGWLRGWFDRLTGPSSEPSSSGAPSGLPGSTPARVAHYAITHKLGEGGMGVVYAARDERLERPVALKMISSRTYDETARRRFWREARTAASVNHPNVCQIYEIGEDQGNLFIAMELLDGESLHHRLEHGPLEVARAVALGLDILAALGALHARGIIHRDLKPSNVFLTPHGVKLLDFGLARPEAERAVETQTALTGSGIVLGTPRYMAPEQIIGGDAVDARSDLFAVGTILFETLAGRPAFAGKSVIEILHATVYEQPPALTGPPVVAAVDRVIRKALAKRPADRPASADHMARELRGIRLDDSDAKSAVAHALTRLVVLPFRVLRPGAETDFLAFSLPDAIATSLSALGPLIVRSSAVGARFAGAAPDLKALAADADVDRVVMGTLLRAGDQLRVTVQLVEAPSGTMMASHTIESPLHDLFRLQDDLARRIGAALSLPLVGAPTPSPDRPHDARAYEYYLRANELARTYDVMPGARDLYERCLELDPGFAPGWAHLGRAHRVIGKYVVASPDSEARAEAALKRALELNPRLAVAHRVYAQLEADLGQPRQAMARLLGQAGRHGNDPDLFVGLVQVCRYCGLYDESLIAHEEARRLDPHARTSVNETLLLAGQFDRLLALDRPAAGEVAHAGNRVIALGLSGRFDEAQQLLAEMRKTNNVPVFRVFADFLDAWLERRPDRMVLDASAFAGLKIQDDPEAMFNQGWLLCDVGEYQRGIERLQRAVAKGYSPAPTLAGSRHFDGIRHDSAFQSVYARAAAEQDAARRAFYEAGGDRLLGIRATVGT
jgi:serine/threonine protein kinase/tetratricopeptide (TPR) repeat protein